MAQAKDYGTIAATASPGLQLQSLSLGFRLWVSACDFRLAAERNMFSQKQPTVKKLNTKGRHNNNSSKSLIQITNLWRKLKKYCKGSQGTAGQRNVPKDTERGKHVGQDMTNKPGNKPNLNTR